MSSYFVLKIQYVNRPPETRNVSAPITLIGRETGDIVLGDPQTSGRHAEIVFEAGEVRVRDNGSTNGTWLNGQRLSQFGLQAGEWFQIGQTTLQLMAIHQDQPQPFAPAVKTLMAMGAPPLVSLGDGASLPVPARTSSDFGAGARSYSPIGQPSAAEPVADAPQGGPGGMVDAGPGWSPEVAGQNAGPGWSPAGAGQNAGPGRSPEVAGQNAGPGWSPEGAGQNAGPGWSPEGAGQNAGPGWSPEGAGQNAGPGWSPEGAGQNAGPGWSPEGAGQNAGPGWSPGAGQNAGPGWSPGAGQNAGPGWSPEVAGQNAGPGWSHGAGPAAEGAWPTPGMVPVAPAWPPAVEGACAPRSGDAVRFAPGLGVRPTFDGAGGELFVTFLAGYLLTLLTLGIYAPWFYCRLTGYLMGNTVLAPTRRGPLRLEFHGRGGELLVTFLGGYLLTLLTLGIYGAWFAVKLVRFMTDNSTAVSADGTRFRARFDGTGGEFLGAVLLGYLLTILTVGIYAPWFYCKFQRMVASKTVILEDDVPVGKFDFVGHGGELFLTYLVGYLLTLVTLGLYAPWFGVKLMRFSSENMRVDYRGRTFAGAFHGTGGELFVLILGGYLLVTLSLGIYLPWFLVRLWKFQINHREYAEALPGTPAPMLAAFPPPRLPAPRT